MLDCLSDFRIFFIRVFNTPSACGGVIDPADLTDSVRPLIKMDKKVKALGMSPILSPKPLFLSKISRYFRQ